VLILADDLGYGELGVQGVKDVPTPHIDSIARNGVRFTDGYVSCPVCSPTRAGLMTGRYQQRFGHEFNPGPAQQANPNFGLALSEVTIANRLKQLGYATGLVGKWHLGYTAEMHPLKRGFDEFFGFLGGAHSYLDPLGDKANPILRGTEPFNEPEYLTEAFAREGVSFIERRRNQPFFLYLAFNAVHAPMQTIDKYLARFEAISDQRRRTFAAKLSALDDGVGRVLAKLRETQLEEDTLIFFVSDNGGPTPNTTSGNGPLRGYKAQVLEGGIRVPFMVQWKGHIPAGRVDHNPIIALDVHPTAVAAAGGKTPGEAALDGVNLLPNLTGARKNPPHDRLFWRFGPQSAVRMGDWKLVKQGNGPPQLYNLAADIGEANDLATRQPDKLKELEAAYAAWNAQLAQPRWAPARAGAQKKQGKKKR
jgi:arylsulfatase A-like enzyme